VVSLNSFVYSSTQMTERLEHYLKGLRIKLKY